MNDMQKLVILIFLPVVLLILILDHLLPGAAIVRYIKLAILIVLFCLTLLFKKTLRSDYIEKKLIRLAFFLVVLSDFLFVAGLHISPLHDETTLIGVIGFFTSYICLILAFRKAPLTGIGQVIAAMPVLAVYIPFLIWFSPWVSGSLFYGTLLFSLVLCGMTWRAICTITERYYTVHVAHGLALAGYLMFISDLAVGLAVFNPIFTDKFDPWLQNIIWSSFICAWIIIVLVLAEKDFLNPY